MCRLFMRVSNMRNKLFSLLLIVLFILGIGILVKPQNSISKNEKRYLNTATDIKDVDSFESTLKDQFYFREDLMSAYFNTKLVFNSVPYKLLSLAGKEAKYPYLSSEIISLNDGYLINDVLYYTELNLHYVANRAYNVNEMALKYPNIKTYVYFPTRLEEILLYGDNFGYDYRNAYKKQLNENIKTAELDLKGIEGYEEYFYKSDFHWNGKGAYQGYSDIINMINDDFNIGDPKEIDGVITYDYEWTGNLASKIGGYGAKDKIIDVKLKDMGDYNYYINDNLSEYGRVKEEYAKNGNTTGYSDYDVYFGDNAFERRFEFNDESKPSLLVFCDSLTNVTQEWIASHFNTTVYIDLRVNDGSFNLDEYIEKYNIDAILVCEIYSNLYFNGNMYIPLG